ncbi:AMP-binding protein [Glycomyces xiaoerkulensis]|uniref:AMP-binding protein n=1 Tax=Glycomyces xiaoerkulensis TaxID=2038139 RepID=UPI0018E4C8D9|nr:AMP-binding protein [Glycomyces xiaoerkulensis]
MNSDTETPTCSNGSATPTGSLSFGPPATAAEVPDLAAALLRAAESDTGGIRFVIDDRSHIEHSYRDIAEYASRILGGMRSRGARSGDNVIVRITDHPNLLATVWACLLGGMVALPLGESARDRSAADLDGLWRTTDRTWIVDWDGTEQPTERAARLGTVGELRTAPAATDHSPGGWDDPALLLLTSGSTGTPKAVSLTHGNILSRTAATAETDRLDASLRSFNWLPLDHVGGLVMFHMRDVYLRCTQVHARFEWVMRDPLRWLGQMDRHASNCTWAPNFAFSLVNDNADRLRGQRWDLSALDYIMNGGEAVKPAVLNRFLSLLAPFGLPADAVHPGWGMSETSSGVVDRRFRPAEESPGRFMAVGYPHPGVGLRIVDEHDRVVPECETGLLQAQGEAVFNGYHNNEEANRRAFTADGWFRTGDLAYVEDGLLTVIGRADDEIVVGGRTRQGHEIESTVEDLGLVEPSFTVAAAVEPAAGQGLAVFCHPRPEADLEALSERVRRAVLDAHDVEVRYVVPVAKTDVPKTGIGKLRRTMLSRRFEVGDLEPARTAEA